mgnify:CR=1 FL=1
MNFFQWLWKKTQARRAPDAYAFDQELWVSLERLADYRGTTPRAVAADLIAKEMQNLSMETVTWQKWQTLSEREQEVTALICLHYKTSQIAERLSISPETVRSHVHNVLLKFELANRMEIRYLLADWDFSAWQ